jgi:hypothetical protein
VRRDRIFEESYHQLSAYTPEELRVPLSVEFIGEQGVDAGSYELNKSFPMLLKLLFFNLNEDPEFDI